MMATEIDDGLLDDGRIDPVHAENLAYRIPAANLEAVADLLADVEATVHADLEASDMNVLSPCFRVE